MKLHPSTRFTLPDELNAAEPPEARGLRRDQVKLLVARESGVIHTRFDRLGDHLRAGDLLVVNTSGTLPAAVDGTRSRGGQPVVVHFSTGLDDGTWVVELRTAPDAGSPVLDAAPGDRIDVPEGSITLLGPYAETLRRLWRSRPPVHDIPGYLTRHGRPIAYKYVDRRWPSESYQTVFADEPGSAEMPSAGRPFSFELVSRLVAAGVLFAPIRLHTGVSSLDSHEPPPAERYDVPAPTARLVNWVQATGGRVIGVGTTAVRAIESAARRDGSVAPASGWTDLVLGPHRTARVVDGLITGMHAPEASHLLLLEAVAGAELVQRSYDAALERGYLWHEFGDACLLLPDG